MAVNNDGTGSAALVTGAPPGPTGPGPAPGPCRPNPPRPPGNVTPSGLNRSLISNKPFRSVLSMTGRPVNWPSILTRVAMGTPGACIVMPSGPIIIIMAPRGIALISGGTPRCPGGGRGASAAAAGLHG